MIIVLEGIDGAGKTTVAKALADRLKGIYQHFPHDYPALEAIAPDCPSDALMAIDILSYSPIPEEDTPSIYVLDRYYQSHEAYGGRFTEILKGACSPADYSFLLHISPSESFVRCLARGDEDLPSVEDRKVIVDRYLQQSWTAVLDGNLSTNTIVKQILSYLPSRVCVL